MNMRKITSMTMLVSVVLLLLNSVILYIVPAGRVSYWADWHLLGLSKTEWADQHITVGVLFLVASVLHIILNWAPIKAYMKNKAKEMKIFTGAFNIALLLTVLVAVGTYFQVPPMSTIITIGEAIKDSGARKYGEPPYGHAELSSLKMFTKKERLDLEKSLELLKAAGLRVEGEKQVIKSIANNNALTPQQVYEIIKPASTEVVAEVKGGSNAAAVNDVDRDSFPDHPRPGFGKRTLAEVCTELQLNPETIIAGLKTLGIQATGSMAIKEIGGENDKEPMEIFEAIRNLVVGE